MVVEEVEVGGGGGRVIGKSWITMAGVQGWLIVSDTLCNLEAYINIVFTAAIKPPNQKHIGGDRTVWADTH